MVWGIGYHRYIKIIFALLKPEEFGITLSETFQIHPHFITSKAINHYHHLTFKNI